MPKIPRDISGRYLVDLLSKYGYRLNREAGSHMRLVSTHKGMEHKITIPDHKEIKIGTLNNILNEIAGYLGMSKADLADELFSK
jgi:predicted RNA binding protein YcfA (HicA-like mRNA interferase family)